MLEKVRQRSHAAARLFFPGVRMPVYALVFVTSRCAAKCKHCFYWKDLNSDKHELTVAEYSRLAKSMGPLFQVTLTGGSPEMRQDLAAIAQEFYSHCRPVNMTLCLLGVNTTRVLEQVKEILTTCPDMHLTIGLSFDGVGREHDELRVMDGLFERVQETAQALGRLKQEYPHLGLTGATTVSGLNYQSAFATAEWVWDNLPVDLVKPILIRGDAKDPQALDHVCHETYLHVVDAARRRLEQRLSLRPSFFRTLVLAKEIVQRDLICNIVKTGKRPVLCSAARETVVIYPDGDVAGCEMRSDSLGNLRSVEMNLRALWFGDKARQFRRDVGAVAACRGCYHHCFLSPPILRSPVLWPRLAKAVAKVALHAKQ